MPDIKVFHSSQKVRTEFQKNPYPLVGFNSFSSVNRFDPDHAALPRVKYLPGIVDNMTWRTELGYEFPHGLENSRNYRNTLEADIRRGLKPAMGHQNLVLNFESVAGMPMVEQFVGGKSFEINSGKSPQIYENHFRLSYFIHRITKDNITAGQVLAVGHDLLVETDDNFMSRYDTIKGRKQLFVLSNSPELLKQGRDNTYKLFYWLGDEAQVVIPQKVKQISGFALEALKRTKGGLTHYIQAGSYWDLCKALLR